MVRTSRCTYPYKRTSSGLVFPLLHCRFLPDFRLFDGRSFPGFSFTGRLGITLGGLFYRRCRKLYTSVSITARMLFSVGLPFSLKER